MEAGDSNYTSNDIRYDSQLLLDEKDRKSAVSNYHAASEISDVRSTSTISRSSNDLTLDGLELLKVFNEFVTKNIDTDGSLRSEDWFISFSEQLKKCSINSEANLQEQLQLCHKQLGQFSNLIKDITIRLREHKCIGAYDPIKPLFVLLEDIRFQQHEIIHSANRLGMLKYENCMSKFWTIFCLKMSHPKMATKDAEQLTLLSKDEFIQLSPNTICTDSINEIHSNVPHRSRYCYGIKNAVKAILTPLLLIIVFIMILYFYCVVTNDRQICDEFIKVVNVGFPPN